MTHIVPELSAQLLHHQLCDCPAAAADVGHCVDYDALHAAGEEHTLHCTVTTLQH